MKRHLFPFTYLYYEFQHKSERLTPKERVRGAWDLLKDMKESGKFLVSPEHRDILHSYGRSLASLIFDHSSELPSSLLAMPLDTSWEIEPDELQAQSQAYVLQRCHRTLLKFREFDSDAQVGAVFGTSKLAAVSDELPKASRKGERIDKTIAYLLQKQLSRHACVARHGPVLLDFLALLRDREPVVSGLRDELDILLQQLGEIFGYAPECCFHLSFVGRESEKKTIRSWLIPDFYVQLHAPVGYGKSALMREVQREVENFLWIPVWIDFASASYGALRDDRLLFLEAFCQQALGAAIPRMSEKEETAVEQIGNKLARIDQEVILFLDHVEYASEQLLAWIAQAFLVKLAHEWVPVRVVAASDKIIRPWQQMTGKRSFRLLPLDEPAVS